MSSSIRVQFWVGKFRSEDEFFEFFGEVDDYYSLENEDRDDYPLSKFISTQDETWYDHDFFEAGFDDDLSKDFGKRFKGYSWSELWGPIVESKIEELGIKSVNAFALMSVDNDPEFGLNRQVDEPQSYSDSRVEITYLGEFELR